MTDEDIAADVERYVRYALGLHIDRDAVAMLIAKRMLYYLRLPSAAELQRAERKQPEGRMFVSCGHFIPETQFDPHLSYCPVCGPAA